MAANGEPMPCKMDPLDPLAQEWVGSQVRMILNQPLPEHYESKLIPWRTGNGPTTWHSITEMPERPKPATSSCPRVNAEDQSPEKDPIARVWDIESQVRMLLNQPPPDPLAQEWVGSEVRRILNQPLPEKDGGKLMPGCAGNGPTTRFSTTEKSGRPKPATPSGPLVKAVDQPLVVLRPCGETHGNKLAAQLDPEGEPKGARTMEGPRINQNQESEEAKAPPTGRQGAP
jgi:hypothetical protein